MPRLTADQWELAKADYEIRGMGIRDIAKRYGVAPSAVSKRAKADGWIHGKSEQLVERKTAAIREIAKVNIESEQFSQPYLFTFESVVNERLQAEGIRARFDVALAQKGLLMLQSAATPDDLETLSRVSRNIRPQERAPQTTVNVAQAQTQSSQAPSPAEVLTQLVQDAHEDA